MEMTQELLDKYRDCETEYLRGLLRDDAHSNGRSALTVDEVYAICEILSQRHPPFRSNEEAFAEFLQYYAPKEFRDFHKADK